MRGTIFVTGAHGVGKTRLIEIVSDRMGIPCYTASNLIKLGRKASLQDETKIVPDKDSNQEVLVSAIDHLLSRVPLFLLDGHTALITSPDTLETIAIEHLQRMSIQGVILLDSDFCSVAGNLLARDGAPFSEALIVENLRAEREYSAEVANTLGVPYARLILKYNAADESSLTACIHAMKEGV
jgi:adenylate kinase